MSAQAGVLYLNGQPNRHGLLEEMGKGLDRYGPDGGDQLESGSVGFVYRACHITPESVFEVQPSKGPGGAILTFDGRLDNREDLLMQLPTRPGEVWTDAAIAQAAFERWGEQCFVRLVGDWAIAAWSPETATVFLARDFSGTCPLYYSRLLSGTVLWSSELEQLAEQVVRWTGSSLKLNEEWIAGYLALGPRADQTPFVGINPVPPGQVVLVAGGKTMIRPHWQPDPGMEIRYRTDGEYEEHFRHLFRNSVRSRLRSKWPIWARLSGGLDSSAIVCMADDILAKEGAACPRLETVTTVFDDSPESDERQFAMAVERQRGSRGHHFSERDFPLLCDPFQPNAAGTPEILDCYIGREQAISEAMRKDAARVQFCGIGGDELLGNLGAGTATLLDHLWDWRPLHFWDLLGVWANGTKRSRWPLFWDVLSAKLPRGILQRVDFSQDIEQRVGFVDPNFRRRTNLDRLATLANDDPYGMRRPSQKGRATGLRSVIITVARAPQRRTVLGHLATPYLDRALATYLLAIPATQLARPGEPRSLMRRSLRDVLPRLVLKRRTKCSPDSALYRALCRNWAGLSHYLDATIATKFGLVEPGVLAGLAEKASHGAIPITHVSRIICLESWLVANAGLLGIDESGNLRRGEARTLMPRRNTLRKSPGLLNCGPEF